MAAERLQKYLARAGVASRRHAEELITAGRVAVNNTTVTELGSRVEPGTDLVSVDGQLVTPPDETSYFLLYKPVGVVTTLSDPQGRPTVANYVEETGKRLFPVGRLDYDAEGALLFTDDGALAHKLTHPSFQVPRTYLAKVKGQPDVATLDKLRGGVRLEDGMATPVSVGVFESAEKNTWLKIVVAEGRPHLIKRLCAAVGHPVVRLFRPAYAGVGVEGLRPGELRPLKKGEVDLLNQVADGKTSPPSAELRLPPRRHGRAAPGMEESDEDELSMDDDAPAPRAAARKSAARADGGKWKPVVDGGSKLARFGRPRAGRADDDRPARRERGAEREGSGRPARKEWGAGAGAGSRFARGAGGEGRPSRGPRGADGEGRPARKSFGAGGDDSRRGGERPARKSWDASGEGRPPRRSFGAGGDEARGGDRPARKSWGAGGDDSRGGDRPARKPFGAGGGDRPFRKSFGAGGEDRPARKSFGAGGEDRPARKSFGAGGGDRPARKPFGAGGGDRPFRKSFGAGGEDRPARKSFGAGGEERPARKSFGAGGGDRPARKPFGAGGGDRPFRKSFGAGGDEGGRGGDRPARKSWSAGGDEGGRGGERPARKSWSAGGDEGGRGGDRPARKSWGSGEGGERPARKSFGAEGARGGDRPARKSWGSADDSGRGSPRRSMSSSGSGRFGGAGRGDSAGEGRPRFGRGAGAGRGDSEGEGRPRFGRGAGAGRPGGRDAEGSGPRGRGGFGAKPGGKGPRGAGGEAREWKPYDDRGAPRERVVRAGSRGGAADGARKSEGFQDWRKKKDDGAKPRWSNSAPRGGRAGSPPRGPRRPR
ncbi:pseudouridine synthase [Myxococcus stipitatus]|uniref:pseudouridine synthase n=1 Tax=Myxococcus stipitatus TaxID=83455 RepID=UPI0030CBD4F0